MDPVFQRLGDVTIQRLDKPKDKVGLQGSGDTVEDESKEDLLQQDVNFEDSQGGVKRNFENLAGPSNKRTKFEFKKGTDESSLHSFSDGELTDYDSESELESDEEAIMKSQIQEPAEITSELETSTDFLDKLVDDPYQNEETEEIKNPDEIKSEVDDYEYDIKEKLKEMGEISFETVKKGDKPKKSEIAPENEVSVTPAKKPVTEEDINERKMSIVGNLRRNIREVMDETKLDESTLAAQRQEMERLRRVQEQQRILRDYQRQIQQERVISLLQGNVPKAGTSGARIGSTVLVKLPNGQTMTKVIKKPFELVKVPKSAVPPHKSPKNLIAIKRSPGNLTPSVSIAPVIKRPPQIERRFSDSDSDSEDMMLSPRPSIQKSKPKDPVTTIDISSDDDCIVVSESENDPNDDGDEDPSNSGLHTNDEFNQPDEQGRVVVNVGHADDEQDVYVAPQIARIIKPHQIGGVRFLFDNVIESVNRFESSTGFGCILAHSMGLGKTLQIVCFSDIFLRHTPARTILCIMPINTLQNWLAEYNMWLPTEEAAPNSPLNAHGEVRPRHFGLYVLNDSHKTLAAKAKVIHEWKSSGGVLLVGYEQYRLLSLRKHPKSRKKAQVIEPVDDDKSKLLFDEVHEALVKPGADLVICDEGHRIKNSHASISQALKQMRTKRRVVLTGYPLQNNLMEYWCMVDFVRPNYLGTKTEFCNMFERPIQNGQCIDSTEADIKLMRYRAHVLHSLLLGFVQRRSHTVLQTALPQKEEYVLLVRMTQFQRTLYETFMNEVVRTQTVPNPLKAFAVCCKIWNHPDVLYYFLKKQAGGETVDIDLEEVSTTTNETTAKPKKRTKKASAKSKNANKPAASITPYNSSGDATSKNKKNSGKNNQTNNQNQANQPPPPPNSTETVQNYPNQNQNYPIKMDFEYSNSSGYGSNNSFSSTNFPPNQNFGESPSYPYSNQTTPSQPSYPGNSTPQSDTNVYPYQQNSNSSQTYPPDSQGFSSNQNQNFEQKPGFSQTFNANQQSPPQSQYPPNSVNQGNSYNNNSNNYGQNTKNYQQPKGPYTQHQNNYPPNQQGSYSQTQNAYPPGEQDTFREPENNFSQQQNHTSFQNQQSASTNYGGTSPYNNAPPNYSNQSGQPDFNNQNAPKHDGNRSGYPTAYNNGKAVYQEGQGYINQQQSSVPQQQPNVPQQQFPNVTQQPNVSQQHSTVSPQQHSNLSSSPQTNISQNTQGYPPNSSAGYTTPNTHALPPQNHGALPHGHQPHTSPQQHQTAPYESHPTTMHSSNTPHSQNMPLIPNMVPSQPVHPQSLPHSQNIPHSQSTPHSQNMPHPQNLPHSQNVQLLQSTSHSQSTTPTTPSMYSQHHRHQDTSQVGTETNAGYSSQHNQNSTTFPSNVGHPQNVDGYPQNVGQPLASGGHLQNIGGHPQNMGQHPQNVQHSQNTAQNVGTFAQNIGHSPTVGNSHNIGHPLSQNINHLHVGHHSGTHHQNLSTSPSSNIQQQSVHPQHTSGLSQNVPDRPHSVGAHIQNIGGHVQAIDGQPGQHQHLTAQNVSGQQQNMGYNHQTSGATSPNMSGNPPNFMALPGNTVPPHHTSGYPHANVHNQTSGQHHINGQHNIGGQHPGVGGQQSNVIGQHSNLGGPLPNVGGQLLNTTQHSHVGGQHSNVSGHNQTGANSQNVISNNPIGLNSSSIEPLQNPVMQGGNRHQQNVVGGHNEQHKLHGVNYGQEKYSGFPQNAGQAQNGSQSQNVSHPQNVVHTQNPSPQNISLPPNTSPPQNSNSLQTIGTPQNGNGNFHQNYPPQSPQGYSSNVTPLYNSSSTSSSENQNYNRTPEQQVSYPNSQDNQNQPPYEPNNSQGYQQHQTNPYQGGSQMEYRGNQYSESEYGSSAQNLSTGNSPKTFQSNSSGSSYQNNQQSQEYSTTQTGTYPRNQQPAYPQEQPYQQNQYSSNYHGGNSVNNQSGNFPANTNYNQNSAVQPNNNKENKGFPPNYKQDVPQSPTNYSTNQSQPAQFQPTTNFEPYHNQQQSSYWNQDYNKPNENYNFKPPFNQNYPNQSQPWKKEDGNKPAGGICPSLIKNESSCDSKPKINIISDIKLSGNSAYDMNKKINILSDIKLEPKKEHDELKEDMKCDVKNETIKQEPSDDDIKIVETTPAIKAATKEDTGIPYDWAIELLKDYVPGIIENSAKMEILFCIVKESIALGDRLLVFSQSLITLDLIEQFLQMNTVPGETQNWAKNNNYYRLDGSTSALEREKLINEFNSNPKIYLFLVSTRAGSLGINLIGANRVVVLDASWNPCHDTQAVCRVYRYGQRKPCFVYRLVVDNCLEKKIYDRQINKQGMSDRVVDECNPDAHLTMKDVSTLCWDDKTEEDEEKDWSHCKDNYIDVVLQKVLVQYGKRLNKEPFQHESLLVDRKDKQLSQQEKRLAKKGYEREKQAARQPSYNVGAISRGHRPVASVRPMQQGGERPTRWIPAEHWQRQGMTAQEMTLPLDVVIPTNQPDKGNIVLKAGQKVLVLKSPKGVYMQLESGKIVAIKTAIKVRGKVDEDAAKAKTAIKNNAAISVVPQKRVVKPFTPNLTKLSVKSIKQNVPNLVSRMQTVAKRVQTAKTKPYHVGQEIARAVNQTKSETESHPSSSDEERTHVGEKRHFNFSKEGALHIESKKSTHSSRNSSLERREMSTDGEDTIPPAIITPTIKPKNVKQGKGGIKTTSSALERLEQSTSTIMAKNKQTFQESLDTITSTYGEDEKLSETSHSMPNQSSQSISSSSEPEVIPVDDAPYSESEPSSTTTTDGPKSDIPAPDYGYNYYGYGHGHMPYPPPPQGYPGYPPQPYDMMGYQQPQYNYGMYPPQGYPPPPQGYPQGPYDYQPPPHPQAPVYPGYPPYPPQQYPPPPQGMYPPPGAPPPAPGYDYGYAAPHGGAPPPAAPYYPGH